MPRPQESETKKARTLAGLRSCPVVMRTYTPGPFVQRLLRFTRSSDPARVGPGSGNIVAGTVRFMERTTARPGRFAQASGGRAQSPRW